MLFDHLNISNSFQSQLPQDPIQKNYRRQVEKACFSIVYPKKTKNPQLIHVETNYGEQLGFTDQNLKSDNFLQFVTGNKNLENYAPFAMCYGGHQFGHWAGQLGDGRAITIAEIRTENKNVFLQLKGSGETPYSRNADGLAVLRSSIREYLCSEAMFHLGISTTRALSLSLTGDEVMRDVLYNGNPALEKGAIVCRASESFLRFGNFELFAFRNDYESLKNLVDYTIKRHYPELGPPCKETYLNFFENICKRTQKTIIDWQRVGFVHGVMNTDNMSILGQTIDYGPYGWLEGYDFNWTPNTTDAQNKRYRFGNQGNIGLWNLLQLANALFPLIKDAKALENILQDYHKTYDVNYEMMMKNKLGIYLYTDGKIISSLNHVLQIIETDMTIFFRLLSNIKKSDSPELALEKIKPSFYNLEDLKEAVFNKWKAWFITYLEILKKEETTDFQRKENMDLVNPKYVLRNYMAQMAIDLANNNDYSLIFEFSQILKNPYSDQPNFDNWFAKRPEWARNKTGCSQLSCSS